MKIKDALKDKRLSPKARAFFSQLVAKEPSWANLNVVPDKSGGLTISVAGLPQGTAEAVKNSVHEVRANVASIPDRAVKVSTRPPKALTANIEPSRLAATSHFTAQANDVFTPSGGYAKAQASKMATPSPDRFARDDTSNYGSLKPSGIQLGTPISPAGGYATATGPERSPIAPATGRINLNPALMSAQKPADAKPALSPRALSNTSYLTMGLQDASLGMTGPMALGQIQTPTMGPVNHMPTLAMPQQQQSTLNPAPDVATPAPEPQQELAPITTQQEIVPQTVMPEVPEYVAPPAEQAPTAMTQAPEPSLTAGDIYGGAQGTAAATGGNFVSRDSLGTTSVTNPYGATTAMTSGGYQSAYGGIPSFDGSAFGAQAGTAMSKDGGTFAGGGALGKSAFGKGLARVAKTVVGLDPNKSYASQRNTLLGKTIGAALGGVIAGAPGAIAGGVLGSNFGSKRDFPDKPSGGVQRNGPERSRSERASISPAADRSMASNGGRTTGLW